MRHLTTHRRGSVAGLAGLAIALLTAGCGPTETAAQIGVRAVPVSAPVAETPSDQLIQAIIDRLQEQLKQADSALDGKLARLTPQNPQFLALLPVLVAERLAGLDRLGTALVDKRLTAVYRMRAQIVALKHLTAAQAAPILGQIDQASSALTSLRATILADTLPDVVRNDIKKVGALHIIGFVDPLAHMTAASDEVLNAADALVTAAGVLQTRITQNATRLLNPAHDQALLADLLTQAATGKQQVTATLASLSGLTAGGYPGNHAALVSARSALQTARVAMVAARNDATLVIADLGG
ncbi:MAG TPA: hypothetical protein VGL20_13025 [Candidatus Dormibacteraeota bacterium]|jgi:hypothetical protein